MQKAHSTNSEQEAMGGFDTLIMILGGALIGSASVGTLSSFFGLADTDATRLTGIAIGVAIACILRFVKRR